MKKEDPEYANYSKIVNAWENDDNGTYELLAKAILREDIRQAKYDPAPLKGFHFVQELLEQML